MAYSFTPSGSSNKNMAKVYMSFCDMRLQEAELENRQVPDKIATMKEILGALNLQDTEQRKFYDNQMRKLNKYEDTVKAAFQQAKDNFAASSLAVCEAPPGDQSAYHDDFLATQYEFHMTFALQTGTSAREIGMMNTAYEALGVSIDDSYVYAAEMKADVKRRAVAHDDTVRPVKRTTPTPTPSPSF